MPNIYLRLPSSRCQYFRNRDSSHPLGKNEPIIFNPYMPEHFTMRNSATATTAQKMVNAACFSQVQWQNMLAGKHPNGGKPIIRRNPEDWLSFAEVQILNGKKEYTKSQKEDYLCIRLPAEVEMVDTVRRVTPYYNLDTQGTRQLIVQLNNDFKRSLVEWALSTFDFCTSHGVLTCRAQTASLERYLMRYGIETTEDEKDNMRRIINRWLKAEHCYFSAYSCMDMQYEDSRDKRYKIKDIHWQ